MLKNDKDLTHSEHDSSPSVRAPSIFFFTWKHWRDCLHSDTAFWSWKSTLNWQFLAHYAGVLMSFLVIETQRSAQTFWLWFWMVVPGFIPVSLVSWSSVLFIFWNGNWTLLLAGIQLQSSRNGSKPGFVSCQTNHQGSGHSGESIGCL